MIYLLDSDTFTHIVRGTNPNITVNLARHETDCHLSAITIREVLGGALAEVVKVDSTSFSPGKRATAPYDRMLALTKAVFTFKLHPYTDEAETLYRNWPKRAHRIGPMDCR